MTTPVTYGYHNVKTDVLLDGYHEFFEELSNPLHTDNRARLETFSGDPVEGVLDWKAIKTEAEWLRLCERFNFESQHAPKKPGPKAGSKKADNQKADTPTAFNLEVAE